MISDIQTFNTRIPFEGSPVTNQRSSGRCWLFASTNVFRVAIMQRYSLKSFELSQAYLFFWDKLEKANYFLENVIDTVDEPLDGRLMQSLLASPVGDGGQWDMVYVSCYVQTLVLGSTNYDQVQIWLRNMVLYHNLSTQILSMP